jgi:hypothetical protein
MPSMSILFHILAIGVLHLCKTLSSILKQTSSNSRLEVASPWRQAKFIIVIDSFIPVIRHNKSLGCTIN